RAAAGPARPAVVSRWLSAVGRQRIVPGPGSDRGRKCRHIDQTLPHRSVVELNCYAVGRIEGAFGPPHPPDLAPIVEPLNASHGLQPNSLNSCVEIRKGTLRRPLFHFHLMSVFPGTFSLALTGFATHPQHTLGRNA